MIISLIIFIVNIMLTFIFMLIAKYYNTIDKLKAIHFCRVALSVKVAFYFPCIFSFSFFLRTLNIPKYLSMLPILYIVLLVIIDAILFFKIIKEIRQMQMSFKKYLYITMFDILIIILPVFFVIVAKELLPNSEIGFYILLVALIILYNIFYPTIIKLKYKPKKQPICNLKKKLTNIEIHNYIVYVYDGTISKEANAMICGLIPPYNLFISDYMIEHMSTEEIESILFHELGHIKKQHLLIKNLFLLSCYPLLIGIGYLMDLFFPNINIPLGIFIIFGVLFAYGGLLFLFISRMQEYQADKYAVKRCGDKNIYICALKKLQELNQYLSKRKQSEELLSTHPSIEKRIEKINKYF